MFFSCGSNGENKLSDRGWRHSKRIEREPLADMRRIPLSWLVSMAFVLLHICCGDVLANHAFPSVAFLSILYVCGLIGWIVSENCASWEAWVVLTMCCEWLMVKYAGQRMSIVKSAAMVFVLVVFVNNVARPVCDLTISTSNRYRGNSGGKWIDSIMFCCWVIVLLLHVVTLLGSCAAENRTMFWRQAVTLVIILAAMGAVVQVMLTEDEGESLDE